MSPSLLPRTRVLNSKDRSFNPKFVSRVSGYSERTTPSLPGNRGVTVNYLRVFQGDRTPPLVRELDLSPFTR